MPGTSSFSANAFPPISEGNASEMANELRLQRMYHKRILRRRTIQFWWYPILFVVLGGVIAAALGQFALDLPKVVFGIVIGAPLIFVAVRYPEFGFVLFAVLVSPFVPSAIKVSTIYVSPALPILFVLFFVMLIRMAFHIKEYVLPSFWTIWPLFGLILMAVISEALIQVTWLPNVPHLVLTNPIIQEEGVGILLYSFPLLTVLTATTTLTGKTKWIEYIQYAYIFLALLGAIIIMVEFKRIGADIFAFRYSSPSIGWMPLEAMAQLLVLGCILSYARFLYATSWNTRILFGLAFIICLLALYFSLENSWWLEAVVALAVMTIVYSRRLFVFFCFAGLPFLPVLHSFLQKLQSTKSVDALRFTIWQDMLRVWSKRPVFGVGPGNLWAYDQVFTHLPQGLRNFAASGLGVAHEGYLQTLGELGPAGLFFQVAFIAVLIVAAAGLFRRSRDVSKAEIRSDRILGLVGLGLICGSSAGDLVASYFFLPPRQSFHISSLPQALMSWVIYGCVIYKDQLWRLARRGLHLESVQQEMP